MKIIFLLQQYCMLLIFVFAAFGMGQNLLNILQLNSKIEPFLFTLLKITTGMAIMIVGLFILGCLGLLNSIAIYIILLIGLLSTVLVVLNKDQKILGSIIPVNSIGLKIKRNKFLLGVVFFLTLPYLVRVLELPHAWDDVMYHLPTAKAWAINGRLTVETWLRYPLFPYNYNLLYASSLLIAHDVFPQLLHMLAGLLSVVLLGMLGKKWFDVRVGILAAAILCFSIKSEIGNAYIDMGVMMFISFGFATLALAVEYKNIRYLYLSGFFMALAMGTKYQALFYLPIYGILVFLVERRVTVLSSLVFIIFVFGGYWFIRNWIISGDPIHPIGGQWFGYWLWNEQDIKEQFADFNHRKSLPHWTLLIGFLALLNWREFSTVLKGLCIASIGSFLIWFFASHYVRYFLPAMPLLALLSAVVIIAIYDRIKIYRIFKNQKQLLKSKVFTVILGSVVLIVVAALGLYRLKQSWGKIAPDVISRDVLLEKRLSSYGILKGIVTNKTLWPVYQLGFEDELYYAPVPVIGEIFGPGRYRDVLTIANSGNALAQHLRYLGAGSILINRFREPYKTIQFDMDKRYFELINRTNRAELYKVKEINGAN